MDVTMAGDDKVVSLTGMRKTVRTAIPAEVLGYWEGLRGGRQVPLRSEVDPRGIERALEYAFVLERIAPAIARFRLAGMHCTELMGMEVRGMPATSFFTPAWRQKFAQILEGVFQGPEMADLTLVAEQGYGKPELKARMLILPLKSDLGDVSRALGCLVSEGPIGRAPRRFDLVEARIVKVVAGQPLGMPATRPLPDPLPEPAPGAAADTTAAPEFAEPPGQYVTAPPAAPDSQHQPGRASDGETPGTPRPDRPKTRGAHLRLVKSDE